MKRFILTALVFVLIIALTIVSTILGVNLHNSNGRLANVEQKLTNLESLLGSIPEEGEPVVLPDFSEFSRVSCNNVAEDGGLIVFFPCDRSEVESVFTVYGIAQGFFENTVNFRISSGGTTVDSGFLNYLPSDIGNPGIFTKEIDLTSLSSGDKAVLRFYSESAMDGSEQKVVEIEVVIE